MNYLLKNKEKEELNKMLELYNNIPNGLEHSGNVLLKYLKECCEDIIEDRKTRIKEKDRAQDDKYVNDLLNLYSTIFEVYLINLVNKKTIF